MTRLTQSGHRSASHVAVALGSFSVWQIDDMPLLHPVSRLPTGIFPASNAAIGPEDRFFAERF
jgi:hypothetical protein